MSENSAIIVILMRGAARIIENAAQNLEFMAEEIEQLSASPRSQAAMPDAPKPPEPAPAAPRTRPEPPVIPAPTISMDPSEVYSGPEEPAQKRTRLATTAAASKMRFGIMAIMKANEHVEGGVPCKEIGNMLRSGGAKIKDPGVLYHLKALCEDGKLASCRNKGLFYFKLKAS